MPNKVNPSGSALLSHHMASFAGVIRGELSQRPHPARLCHPPGHRAVILAWPWGPCSRASSSTASAITGAKTCPPCSAREKELSHCRGSMSSVTKLSVLRGHPVQRPQARGHPHATHAQRQALHSQQHSQDAHQGRSAPPGPGRLAHPGVHANAAAETQAQPRQPRVERIRTSSTRAIQGHAPMGSPVIPTDLLPLRASPATSPAWWCCPPHGRATSTSTWTSPK